MSTIIWPRSLGGPRIQRLEERPRFPIAPRQPRRGPSRVTAPVLFVAFVLDLICSLGEWAEDQINAVYIERAR